MSWSALRRSAPNFNHVRNQLPDGYTEEQKAKEIAELDKLGDQLSKEGFSDDEVMAALIAKSTMDQWKRLSWWKRFLQEVRAVVRGLGI
jgi:hypothetical protein